MSDTVLPEPVIDAPPRPRPAPSLLPTRPMSGDPPRKKAHHRDVVRLERYFTLVKDGVPDDEAVRRVVCDPGTGLREYVLDPTRINRIGEIARARARLLRWAAPEQLERVAMQATARLASSADMFVETIEEMASGVGMVTSHDAQVGRTRIEAAKVGLEAFGVGPKARGGSATTVNVQQISVAQATAQHAATARAGERVARKFSAYRYAVETLLGACPDAELAAKVTARLAEAGLDVKRSSDVEFERRFAET